MTTNLDNAIARLQDIIQASTDLTIKAAPDFPVEDAAVLPLSIAHITGGTGSEDSATNMRMLLNISVDVHFDRMSMKRTYQRIDKLIPEFLRRLGGDPTLSGYVDTIVFPVTVTVEPAQWDSVVTQMVSFSIPIKIMHTPLTTA